MGLRVVITISATSTIIVTFFCRPSSLAVDHTINNIDYIIIIILVGVPIRGSMRERISPLLALIARWR
jgi:hypothetical protein